MPYQVLINIFLNDCVEKSSISSWAGHRAKSSEPRSVSMACLCLAAWILRDVNIRLLTCVISDTVPFKGGKCDKKSIIEMNKEGWRVVQIVTGLRQIGVLFECER